MAEIKLEEVRKSYGPAEVVHGVDLTIPDGEFLVLVGPSGCGKSTILRMIAGLETVTSGRISIDRRIVNRLEPKDRDIAMVFQNYALYPHMSVYQNMAYGLKVRGVHKADIHNRVNEAAVTLGLGEYLDRKPRALSGGQRQRVAMGRALVRNPKAFLFDEPLSNLDAKLRNQMRVELKQLHARLKNTFVYVTHDQVEAMTLGQRIMVLRDGNVEQVGTPDEIYNQPASTFVAGFIGAPSMNILSGSVDGDAIRFAGKAGLVHAGSLPGREVKIGVRPEHLCLRKEGEGDYCQVRAKVALIEPLGGDTVVHCRLNGGSDENIIIRVHPDEKVGENETAILYFKADTLHLFDAETQRRINGVQVCAG